jgi:Amt family ammonium transporter
MVLGKPDLSMILNGCLAGLVAVTAPCAFVTIPSAAIIGLVGGVIVVFAVLAFDKIKIDDPVGALSVHLVNGIWGTLSLGLFYDNDVATNIAALATGLSPVAQTMVQLKGVLYVGAYAFFASLVFWYAIKATMGVRVTAEEEIEGLDIGEHGISAYPDFATHPSYMGGGYSSGSAGKASRAYSAAPDYRPERVAS